MMTDATQAEVNALRATLIGARVQAEQTARDLQAKADYWRSFAEEADATLEGNSELTALLRRKRLNIINNTGGGTHAA